MWQSCKCRAVPEVIKPLILNKRYKKKMISAQQAEEDWNGKQK